MEHYFDDTSNFMDSLSLDTQSMSAFPERLLAELRERNIKPFDDMSLATP